MKKLAMLLLIGLATISCSKDDTPEVAPVTTPPITDTNTLKIYNYPANTEITNNSVVNFSGTAGLVDPTNALKFYFKNTSSSEMKVKIRLVSLSGVPDTGSVSFCYGPNINDGVCLLGTALTVGNSYPRNNEAQIIVPANGTVGTGGANKFQNTAQPVSPATAVDYVLEAFQLDANGNEVGNKVKFTYRYN
jgi:hypothetical protein